MPELTPEQTAEALEHAKAAALHVLSSPYDGDNFCDTLWEHVARGRSLGTIAPKDEENRDAWEELLRTNHSDAEGREGDDAYATICMTTKGHPYPHAVQFVALLGIMSPQEAIEYSVSILSTP